MGLGGHLIWTSVMRALSEQRGGPVLVCARPGLSDLLRGRLWDRACSYREDAIFRGNPCLIFPETQPKSLPERWLDRGFWGAMRRLGLTRAVEGWIFRRALRRADAGEPLAVHVDMLIHSYAADEKRDRFLWRCQGQGRAADALAAPFGVERAAPGCELHFTPEEEVEAETLLAEAGLTPGGFLAIEPETNREWFGDLRAWPFERWREVVERLRILHPELTLVQVGTADSRRLSGVIALNGRTTFRQAALLLRSARLFLGTEGGMMHAAAAAPNLPAVILWGGLTLPEFAGYPDRHRILHHRLECAPCGLKGNCPHDVACMKAITPDETLAAITQLLQAPPATTT
ncbi:MAG: hypothetical protein HQL51_00355 [Magnetococcales bacterium]|nr:hypothetical protein [Magnetococcales bacterium]